MTSVRAIIALAKRMDRRSGAPLSAGLMNTGNRVGSFYLTQTR